MNLDERREQIARMSKSVFQYCLSRTSSYQESEDLINIGAYKAGSNKEIDFAISKHDEVINFIKQDVYDKYTFEEIVDMMERMFPPRNREKAPVVPEALPEET